MQMFKVFGETYYLDLNELEKKTESYHQNTNDMENNSDSEKTISPIKFEIVKTMVEVVMSEQEPIDEMLSNKSRGVSIPFKIAFNTLLVNNIIQNI
jgi:hypothetical protein